MNPPMVYEVTRPSSHKMMRMVTIVDSIRISLQASITKLLHDNLVDDADHALGAQGNLRRTVLRHR